MKMEEGMSGVEAVVIQNWNGLEVMVFTTLDTAVRKLL